MKKVLLTVTAIILLAVSLLPMSALAWETPSLMVATDYNAEKQTITLYYRVLNLEGTESADFRLRYNPDVVEYVKHKTPKMSNVFIEIGKQTENPDTLAIQFVDLYYVEAEDCEEDGSATIATFTFNVIDKKAKDTVFIAFADSCAMDPNSTEVFIERATHKISLNGESEEKVTPDGYVVPEFGADENSSEGNATPDGYVVPEFGADENSSEGNAVSENIKKIIIAASVSAVVLVGGIIVIVVKYRKK